MPRRREVPHRMPPPDAVYNSTLVSKFVNCMMWDGEKAVTERIFYNAMDLVRERANEDPLKIFKKAVENCKPIVEVKSRRVGGANYQVPVEVSQARPRQPGAALVDRIRAQPPRKGHAGKAVRRDA